MRVRVLTDQREEAVILTLFKRFVGLSAFTSLGEESPDGQSPAREHQGWSGPVWKPLPSALG